MRDMTAPLSRQNLLEAVILFGHQLREVGFKVTPAHLEDALRGLLLIQIGEREQFRAALRANLVSSVEDLVLFDAIFQTFWGEEEDAEQGLGGGGPDEESFKAGEEGPGTNEGEEEGDTHEPGEGGSDKEFLEAGEEGGGTNTGNDADCILNLESGEPGDGEPERVRASLGVVEARKDFSQLSTKELSRVEALVIRLARRLGHRLGRRFQIAENARKIDFRRSYRSALRYGGELLELRYRRPKPVRNRIHLLLDISGSMEVYGHFFLLFMYGLQQALARAQCFVFSTNLTYVTPYLKSSSFRESWERIQSLPINWSGGTDIGTSITQFYADHLGLGAASRSVVIIVSDGWDRGSAQRLDEAMGLVHQRCRHLFWLNPLLASPCYEPLCRGMSVALSHVDSFLPLYSLDSLVQLCHKIEKIWRD
jgi:uncharacterized protein with von Willebrand factor type A (vWA) domain